MVKKLFALASVTALTGLIASVAVAGCSSTTTEAGPTTEAGADVKTDAPREAAPEEDSAPPATTCPTLGTPVVEADIEGQTVGGRVLNWLPPTAPQTVCTQTNLDDLKALFAAAPPGKGVAYADIKKSLGTACGNCTFSATGSKDWSVFIEVTGGAIDNSAGSCFAQVKDAACGKARYLWDTCLDITCSETECGMDSAKVDACKRKSYAKGGPCENLTTAYTAACPEEQKYIDACGTFFQAIAVNCAGGPDAGLDASVK